MLFTVVSLPPIGRTSRRLIPIRVSVGLAAVAAALLTALSPAAAWAYCGSNDCFGSTVNSAITVVHYQPAGGSNVDAVEPDTGEDWTITAHWDTLGSAPTHCACTDTPNATMYEIVD